MAKRKSSTYWARRKAQFIVEQMDDAERTAQTMNIVRQYAQERLEKQADKVFERYRLQFGLTEPEARRMLKKSGTSLEELDKLIMRSPKSEVLDNIMARRNAAAYAHRIEALKRTNAEVDALMRTLTKTDRQHTAKLLERVAKNAYANAVSLTGEQLGVDLGFRELDPKYVEELLKTNWMGGNYSKRIWKQNKALGETLKQEFMVNYLTGRSSHDMAQVLSERFGVSYFNSRRLVRTESTFVEAEMEARAYEDLDIEEYEYVSVLDNRTTILCQQHDGKVYKVKERKAGVNYPPLHPFCRATTIAHISGEWAEVDEFSTALKSLQNEVETFDIYNANSGDVVRLGGKINRLFKVHEHVGNPDALVEIFSNFRDMSGQLDASTFATGSLAASKRKINEAFARYPKIWADRLKNSGMQLYTRRSKRGFFSPGAVTARRSYDISKADYLTKYLTIHLSDDLGVEYHEIGHLVEHLSPNTLRISKDWVSSRTAGEAATPLRSIFPGFNYRPEERTKKDNFISPYIGKVYPNATEVLSMGLEALYVPGAKFLKRIDPGGHRVYAKLVDDEEYLNLILGLIVKG